MKKEVVTSRKENLCSGSYIEDNFIKSEREIRGKLGIIAREKRGEYI